MKVYGPYKRKDGRQHVCIVDGKKKRTVSYPKWLIEQKLGRILDPDLETIDHINGDFTDNRLENIRIIPRPIHASQDTVRVRNIKIKCIWCNKELSRKPGQVHRNARKGFAGPFCRPCAGKYGAEVQNGKIKKLSAQPEIPIKDRDYYKVNKN